MATRPTSHSYTPQVLILIIEKHTCCLFHVLKEHLNAFKGVFWGFILCKGITFCVLAAIEYTEQNSKR